MDLKALKKAHLQFALEMHQLNEQMGRKEFQIIFNSSMTIESMIDLLEEKYETQTRR